MKTTDTPRTDAAEALASTPYHSATQTIQLKGLVSADFARQLESDLAKAKTEIERLQVAGIHTCHQNCQRPLCEMRRARDMLLHALEMVRDADEDCIKDGLPQIPPCARHCIDRAIEYAKKETE